MRSHLLRRPAVLTGLALLSVASFGATPALADRDDYRGRDRGSYRSDYRHDHDHDHGGSHGHGNVSFRIEVGNVHRPHGGHGSACRYIPAHCETRTVTICVAPAHIDRRWCEPRYEARYDSCGRRFSICVSSGHWVDVHVPARYETRTYEVHVPARWVCSDGCGYAHSTGHDHY